MHSFSAMTKVEKKKNKNTSPRTAPAMSCSRLKIRNPPLIERNKNNLNCESTRSSQLYKCSPGKTT